MKKETKFISAAIFFSILGLSIWGTKKIKAIKKANDRLYRVFSSTDDLLECAICYCLHTNDKKRKSRLNLMGNRFTMSYACDDDEVFIKTAEKTITAVEEIMLPALCKAEETDIYGEELIADIQNALAESWDAVNAVSQSEQNLCILGK